MYLYRLLIQALITLFLCIAKTFYCAFDVTIDLHSSRARVTEISFTVYLYHNIITIDTSIHLRLSFSSLKHWLVGINLDLLNIKHHRINFSIFPLQLRLIIALIYLNLLLLCFLAENPQAIKSGSLSAAALNSRLDLQILLVYRLVAYKHCFGYRFLLIIRFINKLIEEGFIHIYSNRVFIKFYKFNHQKVKVAIYRLRESSFVNFLFNIIERTEELCPFQPRIMIVQAEFNSMAIFLHSGISISSNQCKKRFYKEFH